MTVILRGKVQSGKNDASYWLKKFNTSYSAKTGIAIFPGSLNLALEQDFDWFSSAYRSSIIWFGKDEYGGERDILFLPCSLPELMNRPAFLWTTTTAASQCTSFNVIEVITDIKLRDALNLIDGSILEVELRLKNV